MFRSRESLFQYFFFCTAARVLRMNWNAFIVWRLTQIKVKPSRGCSSFSVVIRLAFDCYFPVFSTTGVELKWCAWKMESFHLFNELHFLSEFTIVWQKNAFRELARARKTGTQKWPETEIPLLNGKRDSLRHCLKFVRNLVNIVLSWISFFFFCFRSSSGARRQ